MLWKVAISIGINIVIWVCPLLTSTKDEFNQIDCLLSSGKYEQALSKVRHLREVLPSSERLTAWELDFRGGVWRMAHGRECLYYLLQSSINGALDSVSANHSRSDWEFTVVCVALKTGQIRWSRLVNGLAYLAVDPRSDVLYLYYERVLALSPDSGKVLDQYDLPKDNRRIQGQIGILIGSELILTRPMGNRTTSDAQWSAYDVDQKIVKKVNAGDYHLLAPDESRRLIPINGMGWDCVSVPERKKLWSLRSPFQRGNVPLWHGKQLIFIAGTEWQRGAVTSIDLSTGKQRWSTALGWGAYTTNQHQLRGGGYQDNWTPLNNLGEYFLALDGSGRLYLLNPADGRPVATSRLCRDYLAMPFQYGNQLIVPSFNWVRSYSIANLIHPATSVDTSLQVRDARCLLALDRQKEAMELLDRLVERAPQSIAAWSERINACKTLNDTEEEIFSRCQVLSLSGQTSDDVLRNRQGLLRLHNLEGKPAWRLIETKNHIYAGTLAGTLWSIRTESLDFGLIDRLDHEIKSLVTTTELQAVSGNSTHTKRPIHQASAPYDDRIPREWYTEGGVQRISSAVCYRGRQFRSLNGGGVRILSGIEMTDLPSRMDNIGPWKIHLAPSGPLGYGKGVFELDEDLQPIRWLIRPTVGGEHPERVKVMFIRSTFKTIGLVVASSNGAVLQVYSHQGVLLNEAPLGRFVSGWAGPAQLILMGDGYLFSDRQLVWISATKDRRTWRFGPSLTRTSTERWGDRWRYFGDPLLSHACLYATGFDGHLYVFDSTHVVGL